MSYRMLSLCSALLAAFPCFHTSLVGEEQGADQGVVTVTVPDFQATRERLNEGPLGVLWRSAIMADARDIYSEAQASLLAENGVDLNAVFSTFSRGAFRFNGLDENQEPLFSARGQFGSVADSLWQLLATEHEAMDAVHGADQALKVDYEQGFFLRYGDEIAVYSQGSSPLALAEETVATDLHVSLDFPKLLAMLEPLLAMMPADDQQRLRVVMDMVTAVSMRTDFLADGVREQFLVTFTEGSVEHLELPSLNMATMDRMPADALMVLAMAVDMQANQGTAFALSRDELRQQIVDMSIVTPAAGMITALSDPLADFLYAMDGSVVIAVLPSVPFPALAISIPRNDELATALEDLIPLAGIALPELGTQTTIATIPMLPLTLAHAEHGILLTSHPTFADQWLLGEGGGAMASDAAKEAVASLSDGATVSALGFSDTKRVLEVLQGLTPMLAAAPLPIDIDQVLDSLDSLQSSAGHGYVLSELVGHEQRQELKSLFGFVSTTVLASLPARLMAVQRMGPGMHDDIDDWDEWEEE